MNTFFFLFFLKNRFFLHNFNEKLNFNSMLYRHFHLKKSKSYKKYDRENNFRYYYSNFRGMNLNTNKNFFIIRFLID
jgi:hypothetical protein